VRKEGLAEMRQVGFTTDVCAAISANVLSHMRHQRNLLVGEADHLGRTMLICHSVVGGRVHPLMEASLTTKCSNQN